MINSIQKTIEWFIQAIPNPDRKSFNVQLGVHVEEFGEMLDELSPQDKATRQLLNETNLLVKKLAERLKTNPNAVVVLADNRQAFLDSLVDQLVTAAGTGYQQGMNIVGGLDEVNRSNYSKFVEGSPIFDENGKIMKGPDYIKANLAPFV